MSRVLSSFENDAVARRFQVSTFIRYTRRGRLTSRLEALLKPAQANSNHDDVDESKVCDDGDDVDVQLLVEFQVFHIDPAYALATYRA